MQPLPRLRPAWGRGESAPIGAADIGSDFQVRLSAPTAITPALQDPQTAVHNLEHVAWRCGGRFGRYGHGNDMGCAELARHGGRHSRVRDSIHEQSPVMQHRLKQSGVGTTGADGFEHAASAAEKRRLSAGKVCGDNAQWEAGRALGSIPFPPPFGCPSP
jgi:hypothetical protein